ncbi:MAG: LPXTG-motif cell wall anchor protein [Frankiales bacterium]|nr:LPXTG-motif cell wall anchor protein [Frankiales bacterium]
MPVLSLHSKLVPALVAVTIGTAAIATPAFAAPPPSDAAAASKAAALLAHDLSDGGTIVGSFQDDKGKTVTYTDWGRTIDAALALLAQAGHDATLGRALTSVEDPKAVAAYTQGAPGDEAGAAYVGATAKLAFVVAATGGDPTKVGGVNLITQLTSLETTDGRFADRSSFGSFANVFGHAFALLALKQAGQTVPDALVQGLLSAQCGDGSFPETYPKAGTTCTGSVDATGLVLQALAEVGQGNAQATQAATTWLSGQQKTDGSFPGQAPVNSTGYAVLGLDAVGASVGNAIAYLTSQQNADGGLRSGAASSTASDDFATAQALPALTGKTFVASARTVMPQAVLTLARTSMVATEATGVTVQAPPNSIVDLFAYSRPSTTFAVVRTETVGTSGVVTWSVSPLTNTRLYAQTRGGSATPQVVLGVAPALSLTAARTATRTYVFSGRGIPARTGGLVISLYRFTDDTHQVLTAQTRADAKTGSWSLTRAFTGTGRFVFVVRTGNDLQNSAGASGLRSVTIS